LDCERVGGTLARGEEGPWPEEGVLYTPPQFVSPFFVFTYRHCGACFKGKGSYTQAVTKAVTKVIQTHSTSYSVMSPLLKLLLLLIKVVSIETALFWLSQIMFMANNAVPT
jgi:hypothetical protein